MNKKRNILLIILAFIVSTFFAIILTNYYINKKQKELLNSIYETTHKNIFEKTQNLINDKQNTSLAIAISLSKDETLYTHLKNKDFEKLNYIKIAKLIETNSKYKNIWIQIFDSNLNSVYRSWTNIRGSLNFRPDLKKIEALKNISTSISAGLFNIGIKARTPIFDENNNFYGALEVVTHFDSITEDLVKNNISPVVIGDKSIRKNLTNPLLSKLFIDDYYIANENVDMNLYNYIKENGVEKYINIDKFIIENGYLISKYPLFDENKKNLAYIINFMELKSINLENIKHIKIQTTLGTVIALIILFTAILVYYLRDIKYQNSKNKILLNSQPNIVIITNGKEIIDANKQLLKFFPSVKDLEDFKKRYICICYTFEDLEKDDYIINKDYNGKNWVEYIFENQDKNFKVAIKNSKEELRHFSVKTSNEKIDLSVIVTFIDVTNEILQLEKEQNEQRILFQQSKINAIENTLNSIAHHWRQPLSVISTIASGMKLKEEIKELNTKEILLSCDKIIFNTKKLSNTIENFSNFFEKDETVSSNSLVESVNNVILFCETIFEKNSIVCEFTHNEDFILSCSQSDFSDSILNIIENSIHALVNNKNKEDRYILINFSNKVLSIKDSGNGIEEEIITKICEPYFTTKHQSFGVGLGLFTVHEFFTRNLEFEIEFKNEEFEYKNKKLKGLNININFN
ncbi:HAMP domain-containing histidine kinase [Aliarcobacter cryaerophilus]|uniref:PAS domain-containing sensor histidine kinase n=1 Tax=Aliarcobacter cryaerophilus TaxID=28198 RepID=UPI0021B5469D|nr:HAMP domain-containing sensor histidine kinase [Aliarcobacter cryaerophilus]MCT7485480.1 HAMP domain-containing histidine kinase [Aliarcobacter cryaerophilus]MCT7491201.1 HAMP domain-containing histidine kinase [Aliarcobacter cryaerophilus]